MTRNWTLAEKRAFASHMRKNPTPAEARLWLFLERGQLGYHFTRQALLQGYVLDFWCPQARLGIEVDGSTHRNAQKVAEDAQRDFSLMKKAIRVLHFTNERIFNAGQHVITTIQTECKFRHEALLLGALKGVAFDLELASLKLPSTKDSRSSSENFLGPYPPKAASLEGAPLTQKLCITSSEHQNVVEKLQTFSRQKSFPFTNFDKRPIGEKIGDQRQQLQEWLKKKA